MQASAKLSAQAKELAELQRQAAVEGRRSGRRVASPPPRKASPRHPLGTRMSARLRGATQADDVWQEIPNEWLKEGAEEHDGEWMEKDDKAAEMGVNSEPDTELDLHPEPEPDADMDIQLAKTGLESDDDAVSELTELSEITPPATIVSSRPKSRQGSNKSSGNRKKPSHGQTLTSVPEDEIEPEWLPPDDFIEWETVRYFLRLYFPSGLDNSQLSRYVLPCTNGSTFVNTSKVLRITRRRRCTNYFLSKLCPLSLRSFG
jgi:hypothetical protein